MCIDFTGREITVGMRVSYPVRKGSAMWLQSARVESVMLGAGGYTIHARNPEGRPVRITAMDRCVIIPEGTPK